jgi:beta-N-acetylhexosaminidase
MKALQDWRVRGAMVMAVALLLAVFGLGTSERTLTPEQSLLRKMIGQMLVIGFPGTSLAEEWPSRVAAMIRKGEIGGVLLLSRNVRSPGQLQTLTRGIAEAGGEVKPFIAIDQEGGAVQRLTRYKGFSGLPAAALVALSDADSAFDLYSRQARELAAQGITVNLGPVVDLDVAPDNPVISGLGRSYGARPEAVMPFARAFIKAHRELGLLTAAKHFPGHGSSAADPHDAVARVTGRWSEAELEPFRQLIEDQPGVPMIMVGHVVLEGFSDGDAPASLSYSAVTKILRGQLGYDGLVITDDLDMGAVRDRYPLEEAFVKAAAAGNDLVLAANNESLDPDLVTRVTEAIAAAVEKGTIPRRQIETSYRRILAAKRRDLSVNRPPGESRNPASVAPKAGPRLSSG